MPNNNQNQQNRAGQLGRLTEEDNKWINTRAAEMARGHSREQMQKIVDSMEPNVRTSLNQKTIDPIIYHFRMQATKEFRMRQQQQAQAGMNMNANRMQTPNPPTSAPMTQSNQTPFMGNIDQFRGQQEEGMRSQQEGQLVVPASTSNPNQGFSNDVPPQQQVLMLRQLKAQNPNASPAELKQMLTQKTREFYARQQAQRQSQMMQGQNQTSGMPQPQNMNMLNQPTSLANDNNAQNNQRPASRPQSAQQVNQPAQAAPYTLQQIIQNFERFPPQVQAVLNARPRSDWVGFIQTWQRRQKQQEQQLQQQQMANNMQRSMSQQPQSIPGNQNLAQTPIQQFSGPAAMQASLSAGPSGKAMPNMTPQMSQQPMQDNTMQMLQQHQQRQQQQMAQMRANGQAPQQQGPNQQIEQQLLRETMNSRLPPQVAQKLQTFYSQHNIMMPNNIPTWANLRAWMQSHGGANPPQPAINSMQLNHARFMRQQQAQMANQGVQSQNNAGNQMQGLAQPRPGAGPQMPSRLNVHQLQQWKSSLPGGQNLSDQQAMKLWEEHQQKRQSNQHNQQLATNQAQNGAAAPVQRPQPNAQQAKPAAQNQAQPQPAPTGKPIENRKRPNQDDAPETAAVAAQAARPAFINLSKEDIAKLPPAKQQQVLMERQNYGAAVFIRQMQTQISKEVSRTPPITNMDQATRQKITARLTDGNTKKMLERFDNFLVTYMRLGGTQDMLRVLIQHRFQLEFQYTEESWKDKTYQVANHFTMTYENLDKILTTLTRAFQNTLRQTSNQTADGVNNTQAQTSIPLTQENLNAAAQQAAQQQKAKGQKTKDGPPPAPTTEKPATQWPVPDRGHGTPKYANPGFQPEALKLPPKKKHRAEATPSPVTQLPPEPAKPMLKCDAPGCTIQPEAFASDSELKQHINTVHKPEIESVKDPVGFLNSSLQQAFNLDETLRPKKAATGAKKMEKTASQGSKTGTITSMARTASQAGTKAVPHRPNSQPAMKAEDSWIDANFSWDDVNNIFGPSDSGDVMPLENESQDQLDKVLEAYSQTEDYKRVFGPPESCDSSAKSKSPDQGSEPSIPENKAPRNQDPYHIDFNIDGNNALPELEGGAFDDLAFDDELVVVEKDGTGSIGSFEIVDRAPADEGNGFSDDFDFGSWIQDDGTNDMNNAINEEVIKSLETKTDWDELYAAGPARYAAGSMAWNAVGKSGQELRRQMGWPVEGAAGTTQGAKSTTVVV